MCRAEIIANSSVQEEIIEALESVLADILYTVVPTVHGKGRENKKLGTVTWPELNFILISYIGDGDIAKVKSAVASVKARFPGEGIKLFLIPEIAQ